jgi:tRNA (Thr-GGU) A37 N-methylase
VRLVAVEGSTLRFRGVDMVDGTLLLDLKPYFPDVDVPDGEVRCGWMDTVTLEKGSTPASLEP